MAMAVAMVAEATVVAEEAMEVEAAVATVDVVVAALEVDEGVVLGRDGKPEKKGDALSWYY